ncbi:MAG TPA: hypothetical protein VMC81_03410 [Rhodocyclaceae bacterium]|nr:hypothetical protein [Rhodocyclaceae bacterium]
MKFLGAEPIDPTTSQRLVAQAAESLGRSDWHGAVTYLESAAIVAAASTLPSILDTLASLYVTRNQHDKLARLVVDADDLTPQLAIGALLLERNWLLGIGDTNAPRLPLDQVLSRLREHIGAGQYLAEELVTICSLLVVTGTVEMALQLLQALLEMRVQVDEELASRVLALALDRNRKAEARIIIDLLAAAGDAWRVRSRRYRLLLGDPAAEPIVAGQDKVIDFMASNGHRFRSTGRSRGR